MHVNFCKILTFVRTPKVRVSQSAPSEARRNLLINPTCGQPLPEKFVNIFAGTHVVDPDDMLFVIDIVEDPKFFCPQGIIAGKFPFQGLAQERRFFQFFQVLFYQGFYPGVKRSDLVPGSFRIEKTVRH